MWQKKGVIVQIDTLCSFRYVSEHFGVYVFYGIECVEPEILYIGQSKFLINRLSQHLRYPTQGEQTSTFYTVYRDHWKKKKRISEDAHLYWKQYWHLLCRSKLMAMAWPIDNNTCEETAEQIKAIKILESKLIRLFKPKYNNQENTKGDLKKWCIQDEFDELSCKLRQGREAMRQSGLGPR